jgi:hypothetical protein
MARKLANYISELDQYLQVFDKNHLEPSRSQQEEQKKHNRIRLLRDNPSDEKTKPGSPLWKEF